MFWGNNFGEYLDNWKSVQKQLVAMEQLSPQTYGELLAKRRKRKKKRRGK